MASQIKKMEDFTIFEERPARLAELVGRGLYIDSKGHIWLIKNSDNHNKYDDSSSLESIQEAYAANVFRLLVGDEYAPETCLVEDFNPFTKEKRIMLASKINSDFIGILDLQSMSPEANPISLDKGKISIHNHQPDGLIQIIIASFIIADYDLVGGGEGNIGVDKDKAFRIDFGQAFKFNKFVINRQSISSLFMLLRTFGPLGAEQTILSLFMPDKNKIRKLFGLFVAHLQSPECKEKLIRLTDEYEGYYAQYNIKPQMKLGDLFLTPLQKRIECFCYVVAEVQQAQLGHLRFSFMNQGGQNCSKTKEIRKICREFFQYYAECVSVLLPNYVEAETAVCMALWSSEPEKVIEKLTQCMALVDERKTSIKVIAQKYSHYGGKPEEEMGQYLTRELTEKLARMEMLQCVVKASINAAVSELEVSQLEATDAQVFFAT